MNRHISNLIICVRYLPLVLLFLRLSDLCSQTLDCNEFPIAPTPGDTILIQTDPNRVAVRVDTTASGQDRTVVNAACVDIGTSGFYRIRTGIIYSNGQSNESFYLTLRNSGAPSDSMGTSVCPTNAGPYLVVQDVVGDTSVERFNQIRDAGLFRFEAGLDTIVLNHYFNIQESYPLFLNPAGELITGDDIESVHIYQIELQFISETRDGFGPKLSKDVLDPETGDPIESVEIGQPFIYRLALENVGPDTARDVILTDFLPEGITINEATFSLPPTSTSADFDTLMWRLDSLAADESMEISFQAAVDSLAIPTLPFTLLNRAVVESECSRDSAAAELLVVAPPAYDLALDKTVTPTSAQRGEFFEYRIQLENLGPDPASNIRIEDVLPEFVEHSDFVNPPVDTTVTDTLRWLIDSLAVGESMEMLYRGIVPPSVELPTVPFPRIDRAQVFSLHDNNAINDTASATVDIVTPIYDLSVTKTVTPEQALRGEVFTYTIEIANAGPDEAEEVLLLDVLPEFVSHFDFVTPPVDTTATDTLRWSFDSLAAGESISLSFKGVVPKSFVLPTVPFARTNHVRVSGVYDTNPANDTTSATVDIITPQYDLSVSKSVSPTQVLRGEIFTYTISINNAGPDQAENITLTDILPEFVNHFDFQTPPMDTTVTDTLVWAFDSLAVGESISLNFKGVVPESVDLSQTPFTRTNLARISGMYDTNSANDTASASVDIVFPSYDLEVIKSVEPTSAKLGQPFSYSILVRNNGPDTAENVLLWDHLPDLVTLFDFVNPPSDTTAADSLRWNLGTMTAGDVREFRYRGVVPTSVDLPEIPLVRTNTAGVISEFDRDTRNDTSSVSVSIFAEEDCIVLNRNAFRPAREQLQITFELQRSSPVSIKVYDITGYQVSVLEEKTYSAGTHEFLWDGRSDTGQNVGSGVYLIIFRSNTLDCLEKVIIVR